MNNDPANDIYINTRWNNQFSYLSQLPNYLQTKVDKNKNILKRYEEFLASKGSHNSNVVTRRTESNDNSGGTLMSKVFQTNEVVESAMQRYEKIISQKPEWHPPWELTRVINGHMGWIRCISVDPIDNAWFATGSNDATIKAWDLESGKLKLTLQGHIMTVKDICISKRHPYMFSASEDKLVKCWDLEKNTSIRDFHGHLSGVHSVDIHPTLDIIVSAGRDSVIRLWDIRTRSPITILSGHTNPINKVKCLPVDPQIISCSTDKTIRLWDITAGKVFKSLTHHKRNIRDIALSPVEFSFASACTDDIRSWTLPKGNLLTNFQSDGTNIINSLSINQDNVLFAGGDDGSLNFYDYKSGHKFQSLLTIEVPGSLKSERGIMASSFDLTGHVLITGETDKSIKIWIPKQDASKDTDPGLPWNPSLSSQRF